MKFIVKDKFLEVKLSLDLLELMKKVHDGISDEELLEIVHKLFVEYLDEQKKKEELQRDVPHKELKIPKPSLDDRKVQITIKHSTYEKLKKVKEHYKVRSFSNVIDVSLVTTFPLLFEDEIMTAEEREKIEKMIEQYEKEKSQSL